MRNLIVIKLLGGLLIILLLVLSVVKVDTNIYVGDHSRNPCPIDLLLKIDDEIIFKDSLYGSEIVPTILRKKLRYRFHKINMISKKAKINQENRVFLYPNQHISIEFYGADTLFPSAYIPLKKDTLEEIDSLFQQFDSMKTIVRHMSEFSVESQFNPFRTE